MTRIRSAGRFRPRRAFGANMLRPPFKKRFSWATRMSTCAGNVSREHRSQRDVAARSVRVGTERVRLLAERIGLSTGKHWDANPELDLNSEFTRCRSYANAGFNIGVCRELNAFAPGYEPHDSRKAGRKQLLRIGPPAVRAAQL